MDLKLLKLLLIEPTQIYKNAIDGKHQISILLILTRFVTSSGTRGHVPPSCQFPLATATQCVPYYDAMLPSVGDVTAIFEFCQQFTVLFFLPLPIIESNSKTKMVCEQLSMHCRTRLATGEESEKTSDHWQLKRITCTVRCTRGFPRIPDLHSLWYRIIIKKKKVQLKVDHRSSKGLSPCYKICDQ